MMLLECDHVMEVFLVRPDHLRGGKVHCGRCAYCRHEATALQSYESEATGRVLTPECARWVSVCFCPCVPCTIARLTCRHDFSRPGQWDLRTGRQACPLCATLGDAVSPQTDLLNAMAGVLNGGVRFRDDGSRMELL